ncbi:30S ribosomal protein S9 [Candidatus Vidania fulgoroideae]|uniref:Small ribosomal subunit protein uS9 n=1 Tax=Candidatus Vidania fulgoroideorum TaxID=881286 RepID=A0A974X770_9PROT|nr:30S ribosomal protein S9 [Candidatus Vidania fulgoroideae]
MILGSFCAAVGKRKSSTARVLMRLGSGLFFINNIYFFRYFTSVTTRMLINEVLCAFNYLVFDIFVTLNGGGICGQVLALRLALCRCLCVYDSRFVSVFKSMGFLNYDSRVVERKKIGFVKSRKRKQFSKR